MSEKIAKKGGGMNKVEYYLLFKNEIKLTGEMQ